jgi:hypothetical protein
MVVHESARYCSLSPCLIAGINIGPVVATWYMVGFSLSMLGSLCWSVDLSPFVSEVCDGTEQPEKYHIFSPQLGL